MLFRTNSDVPIKIRDFAIVLTDSTAFFKLHAKYWHEVEDVEEPGEKNEEAKIDPDFILHPNKCYKLTFIAEQYQFCENSELQVRIE